MVYLECIMHFPFKSSYFVEYLAYCAVCDIYLRRVLYGGSMQALQEFSNETQIPFWTWRIKCQSAIEWNARTIPKINHHFVSIMSKLNPYSLTTRITNYTHIYYSTYWSRKGMQIKCKYKLIFKILHLPT